MSSDNASDFYKAVNAALSRFVQDKLNIELTDFNTQTVKDTLTNKHLPDELISEYFDTIQDCDFKQFAGTNSSSEDKKDTLDKAKSVITRMEKYI